MIAKPKTQLFNFTLYVSLAVFSLAGVFFYAVAKETSFFILLVILHVIILTILISYRRYFIAKNARVNLQVEELLEKSNVVEVEIQQEHLAVSSMEKQTVNYSNLKDLTEKLSLCLSLSDTSNTLSSEVDKLFKKEDITTILYLFHSKTGELGLSSSQKGQIKVNIKSKKGDVFDEWVIKNMQSLLVQNIKSDFRFDTDKIDKQDGRSIGSLISVPLKIGDKALGILRLDSPHEHAFSTENLRFITTAGDLGSLAIENAQLYEKIEELAIRDGLTDLYLRRYLLSRMSEEISRQLRRKKELSLLMIDLDKFKDYNDTFGHMAGDAVLKTIGWILQDSFQDPGSLVSRYGGEEFAILLPDCSKTDAVKLAEELRKRIKKQEIVLRNQKTNITVSIGVATFPTDAQIKDDLIYMADNALYEAKAKGRDRTCAA